MPSTDMVMATTPQQTLLEKKIAELGFPATKRLVSLLVSITIGVSAILLQTSYSRTHPIFTLQCIATALFLSITPIFVHAPPDLTNPLHALPLLLTTTFALLPALFYFFLNLVYGHVHLKDAQWYDALWRIYGVLFLWMLFAIINEAKIRPFFRARAIARRARLAAGEVDAAPPPPNSVAARADAMRRKARDEKLAGIREALIAAKRRREAAKKAVDGFEGNVVKARENVVAAEAMVEKAEGEEEKEVVEKLLEGAVAHENGLEAQTEAQRAMLEDCEEKIKELDEKWRHWSVLDNYPFYR